MGSKVYTKTGDQGKTSLLGGDRVLKCEERIEIYGELDELNAHFGVITGLLLELNLDSTDLILEVLQKIQNDIFNLSGLMASQKDKWKIFKLKEITKNDVNYLEQKIDLLDEKLPPLENFILPGGSVIAAQGHVARCVCRRVERKMVDWSANKNHELPEYSLAYINRLSDLLFVLARYLNYSMKVKETIWKIEK